MPTPVSSCVTTDEAALERIRQLENDLMIMRQQLAAITLKQEQLNGTTAIGRSFCKILSLACGIQFGFRLV